LAGTLVHAGQTVLAEAVHTDAVYWPLVQATHGEGAVTPWVQ
jgi:hypothetical protein